MTSIKVAGDPAAQQFVAQVAALVPEHHYAVELRSEDAALALLTFDGAIMSVLCRPPNRDELVPYRKIVRQEPVLVPVARATPWQIYVHAGNPVEEITYEQLPRIFRAGEPAGDLRRWSQLGVRGLLAGRRIETMAAPRHRHFLTGGVKGASQYLDIAQPQDHPDDEAAAAVLANDPAGILVARAGLKNPGIRPLGLTFERTVNFVLRQSPRPEALALLQAALSDAGQALAAEDALPPELLARSREQTSSLRAEDVRPDPDPRVQLVGNDGMAALLDELNETFEERHPSVRFRGVYEGSSPGFPALISRATPFTAMAREVWPAPLAAFRATHGRTPRSIQIGYSGHGPRDNGRTPPSLYVHRENPIEGLDIRSVARILTDGHPDGDLTRWGQLGAPDRRIHVYLPDDGLGFVGGFQARYFPTLQLSARCENVGSRENVIRAVADDPFGIGLTGWCAAGRISDRVRQLPLAHAAGQPFVTSSLEEVADYPLTYPLNLYLWEDERGIDPIAYAYCGLALSDEGQAAVGRQTATEEGYVRLSPADLEEQRTLWGTWATEVAGPAPE